jgi:REP element-mobilizing transposase RayT
MPTITDSPTGYRITIHCLWRVNRDGPELGAPAWERLPGYVTRYAQTLGVRVHAVGGGPDHLHWLFDLPSVRTVESVNDELRRASARYLAGRPDGAGFAWAAGVGAQSVSTSDSADLAAYIGENAARHATGQTIPEWEFAEFKDAEPEDELPAWLRSALSSERPTE